MGNLSHKINHAATAMYNAVKQNFHAEVIFPPCRGNNDLGSVVLAAFIIRCQSPSLLRKRNNNNRHMELIIRRPVVT